MSTPTYTTPAIVAPEDVARATPPQGSDHALATNRDHVAGDAAGKLTDADLTITRTARLGVWMGYTLIVGEPTRHGTVADEAAMLALHDWADDPHTRTIYHYVQVGDSVLRADDPGYYWTCIAGHGTALSQWERRPLAGALTGLAVSGHTHTRAQISDASFVGRNLIAVATPTSAKLAQINADASVTLIDVPSGGGGGLDSDALIGLLGPLAWWRADAGVEETDGDPAEDGDGVSRWIDQSGHGYHLTQATAGYRPTHEAGEIGGRAIIRFAAHHLTNAALPLDLKNHTMVVVAKSTATSGQNYGRLACVGLPASGYDYNVANAQTWTFDNTGTPEVRVNSGNENYWLSLSYTQVGRPASLRAYGYRITSGSAILSASDLLSAAATNNYSTTSVGLNIGCQWKDGAAQPTTDNLHADVCEIVVFDRALGSTLFGLILSALARKWGM